MSEGRKGGGGGGDPAALCALSSPSIYRPWFGLVWSGPVWLYEGGGGVSRGIDEMYIHIQEADRQTVRGGSFFFLPIHPWCWMPRFLGELSSETPFFFSFLLGERFYMCVSRSNGLEMTCLTTTKRGGKRGGVGKSVVF